MHWAFAHVKILRKTETASLFLPVSISLWLSESIFLPFVGPVFIEDVVLVKINGIQTQDTYFVESEAWKPVFSKA